MKDENEFSCDFLTSKVLMKNITHLKYVKRIESNHEKLVNEPQEYGQEQVACAWLVDMNCTLKDE